MAKLSGNRKIGELPEQRRLRQSLDEIIKEEIAELESEHVNFYNEKKVEDKKNKS